MQLLSYRCCCAVCPQSVSPLRQRFPGIAWRDDGLDRRAGPSSRRRPQQPQSGHRLSPITVTAPTTVTPMNTVGISADIQRHCVSSAVNAHRNDTTIATNKPLKNAFRTSIVSPKLAKPHNDFLNDTLPAPYPDAVTSRRIIVRPRRRERRRGRTRVRERGILPTQ